MLLTNLLSVLKEDYPEEAAVCNKDRYKLKVQMKGETNQSTLWSIELKIQILQVNPKLFCIRFQKVSGSSLTFQNKFLDLKTKLSWAICQSTVTDV